MTCSWYKGSVEIEFFHPPTNSEVGSPEVAGTTSTSTRARHRAAAIQEEAKTLNIQVHTQLSMEQQHFGPERTTISPRREICQKYSLLVSFYFSAVL